MDKTKLLGSVFGLFLAAAIGTIIFLIISQPETKVRQEYPSPPQQPVTFNPSPTTNPKVPKLNTAVAGATCTPAATPTGVKVAYPGCQNNSCQYAQASCSWNSMPDAASYNYVVTEVETGSIIANTSVPAATTQVLFSITQGKTYKCDVTSVNSCGSASAVASDQLLCQTDAAIPTPTPTIGVLPSPTPTLMPTSTPTTPPAVGPTSPPPVLKPGGIGQSVGIVGVVGAALLGGFVLLLF